MIDPGRDGFRTRLKESIDRTELSQSDVGRRIGVERSTVNAWVRGRRTPDLETTRKLAAVFGWPIPEMLSWFGIYEPVAPEVDKPTYTRQVVDNPAGMSTLTDATVTAAVTAPPHTPSVRPPEGESIPVPSLSHRAAYYLLAQLPTEVLEQEIIPNVAKRIATLKARREQADKKASEGG